VVGGQVAAVLPGCELPKSISELRKSSVVHMLCLPLIISGKIGEEFRQNFNENHGGLKHEQVGDGSGEPHEGEGAGDQRQSPEEADNAPREGLGQVTEVGGNTIPGAEGEVEGAVFAHGVLVVKSIRVVRPVNDDEDTVNYPSV